MCGIRTYRLTFISKEDHMDFIPAKLEIHIPGRVLTIDTENSLLNATPGFSGTVAETFPAVPVMTDKIRDAFREKKLYLSIPENREFPSRPLYMSMRNVTNRTLEDGTELYVDVILYNGQTVLPSPVQNRSLGHANDIHELEVFQVLEGEIVSVFIDPGDISTRYIGVFGKNQVYAVPPGWFHCTYISQGPAVVANFYCHAFWKADIEKKPYFKGYNPVSFEIPESGPVFRERGQTQTVPAARCCKGEIGVSSDSVWRPYTDLFADNSYFQSLENETDIFDLFNSEKIADWLAHK